MGRAKVTGTVWPAELCTHHSLSTVKASAMGSTSAVSAGCQGVADKGGARTRTESLFLGLVRLPQRVLWLLARVWGMGDFVLVAPFWES